MATRVAAGSLADIPPGTIKGVDVGDRKFVVVNVDGTLYGLDGVCTHAYYELARGVLAGDRLTCMLHLSGFDVRTGEAINPPAEEPLAVHPVEVEGDQVFLILED
jgi:3-phenylpropionate/trans-cinnamate dioxygenase ferredoxin subunit